MDTDWRQIRMDKGPDLFQLLQCNWSRFCKASRQTAPYLPNNGSTWWRCVPAASKSAFHRHFLGHLAMLFYRIIFFSWPLCCCIWEHIKPPYVKGYWATKVLMGPGPSNHTRSMVFRVSYQPLASFWIIYMNLTSFFLQIYSRNITLCVSAMPALHQQVSLTYFVCYFNDKAQARQFQ